MKLKYSFIATASSVLLSLTSIVAEASSSGSRTVGPLSPQQDSKVPASMPSTASVTSLPLKAKVIDCVGKVKWRAGADIAWKDAKDAAVEDLLSAGAEVRTGLRSRMTLKFDNATVLIDSNSNFAMPTLELVKENDGDVYRTVAQMKSGRGDFQVDKVGAKNDFKVVTPSSTLAVRGTGFSVHTGAMSGTEVVGARTNAIAAIQLKYAATSQVVQMSGGGEAKSSSISPEPATAALMSSIGALPMVGTATSVAEHEISASMGTTQTTAQTQIVATVATVSQAIQELTDGNDDSDNSNSVSAIFADIQQVDNSLNAATVATQGAGVQLQAAIDALAKAQAELANAQFHAQAARVARIDVTNAAASVAEQLVLVNAALTESGEARSSALENARQSLLMFATLGGTQWGLGYENPGSGTDVRGLADLAISEADRARSTADDALSGSELVVEFSQTALERLNEAFASQRSAQNAAIASQSAAFESQTAAESAREFLALVQIARDEIASIYANRPLSGIAESLSAALLRLELSSQAVIAAESARDDALTAALSAQADAQDTVLDAVQAAALSAAQDALNAFTAASAAESAAIDSQDGMATLDLAIDAMLTAQDKSSYAEATQEAAQAFRVIAQARGVEAQAQIDIHSNAANDANNAQLDAAQALVEALGHLDSAIENSGFTTDSVAACLAALNEQNQDAATSAAIAARGFADATQVNADDAGVSAVDANEASGVAGSQTSLSADALSSYTDRLAEIRAALVGAVAKAAESASAAVASSTAAGTAQTYGNAFALQFTGSDASQAALDAVERALTLASDAGVYAENAEAARDAAAAALAAVTDENGDALDFTATDASVALALENASDADDAAIEAARLAAIADAEAFTAETAVGSLTGLVGAQVALANVEFQGVSVADYAAQIDDAIQVHDVAFAGLQGAADGAAENLSSAITARNEAQLQDTNVFDSFEQMLLAMSSGDANLAMSFSQTAGEQADSANDAADAAVSAYNAASDQDVDAAELAATSHTQQLLAQDALNSATALSPSINANSALAQQRALDSQVSAGFSQGAATLAGSELAQALADRALALSVLALERASAAIAARDTALEQVANGSSAIEQASFQQSASLAGQAHQFALDASFAANDAQLFAINANNYANLAQSSAGAFLESADAFAFRVDADIALGSTIFARDTALQAIGVHNEALTTVSTLFTSAGVSLAEAQSQMNFAIGFANDANVFFLATTLGDFSNAYNADNSATQSEFASVASDSSAIETLGYANEALLQAGISQQAGIDYATALEQADGFAAAAGTATSGATVSAAQALAFSQAASNFAAAIGSAQADTARDFAIAARDQAIVQRSGALASRDAALAAADSARSMGERVFFTRTAEIAADTVARADQARIFADQAIQAATNARTDATSAMNVANGGGETSPPTGNGQ